MFRFYSAVKGAVGQVAVFRDNMDQKVFGNGTVKLKLDAPSPHRGNKNVRIDATHLDKREVFTRLSTEGSAESNVRTMSISNITLNKANKYNQSPRYNRVNRDYFSVRCYEKLQVTSSKHDEIKDTLRALGKFDRKLYADVKKNHEIDTDKLKSGKEFLETSIETLDKIITGWNKNYPNWTEKEQKIIGKHIYFLSRTLLNAMTLHQVYTAALEERASDTSGQVILTKEQNFIFRYYDALLKSNQANLEIVDDKVIDDAVGHLKRSRNVLLEQIEALRSEKSSSKNDQAMSDCIGDWEKWRSDALDLIKRYEKIADDRKKS